MEAFLVKTFEVIFKAVGVLLVFGLMGNVLSDLQTRAFNSKRVGLVSMLKVNQQLVGKTE